VVQKLPDQWLQPIIFLCEVADISLWHYRRRLGRWHPDFYHYGRNVNAVSVSTCHRVDEMFHLLQKQVRVNPAIWLLPPIVLAVTYSLARVYHPFCDFSTSALVGYRFQCCIHSH